MAGKSGGKAPRRKGTRAERELARLLGGERVPLSGSAGGSYSGDVVALDLRWEVKVRRDGFRQLYRWLDGRDAVALKADRRPWLVVLPLTKLMQLLQRDGGVEERGE